MDELLYPYYSLQSYKINISIPNLLPYSWIVFQICCHIFGLYSKYIAFWGAMGIGEMGQFTPPKKIYICKSILFITFAGQPATTE